MASSLANIYAAVHALAKSVAAKHLNAARAQLPEVPAPGLDGATISGFDECLQHKEMELALDELEDLGLTNAPPPDFWRHLIFAAESMELSDGPPTSKGKWETHEA